MAMLLGLGAWATGKRHYASSLSYAVWGPEQSPLSAPGLETSGTVGGNAEDAFQGHAGPAERALIKQAADQRDAVGNAARRNEFWQGVLRVGRPIGAHLGDFDKTGAKRQ